MNQEELVLYLSLHYLDDISLVKACQVNTRFYQRVCNQIWFDRLEQNYFDVINTFPNTIRVKSYREQYLLLQDLNNLKSIYRQFQPLSLLDIYQLEILNLNNLGLTFLPREIRQLTNLQELNLSYNQLTNLPREIGQLNNLRMLLVSRNQLNNLPEEIGQLNNLLALGVSRNQLTEIPREIRDIPNLLIVENL